MHVDVRIDMWVISNTNFSYCPLVSFPQSPPPPHTGEKVMGVGIQTLAFC